MGLAQKLSKFNDKPAAKPCKILRSRLMQFHKDNIADETLHFFLCRL